MIKNMLFHISVVLLIIGCGKYEDSIENPSPNNILVEVEAPQTNGWSTEEIAGTRSGITKTVKQKGEYDLNIVHCITPQDMQPMKPPPAGQTWKIT